MADEVEQNIIDNIMAGISIFVYENQKLKLIRVNKKLKESFGINLTKLENNNTTPFLHPDDKKIIENSLENIKQNNENINFSARYYNYIKNQYSYFHVKANITNLGNKSLKIYLTYGTNSFNLSGLDKYKVDALNKLGIILWKYNPKEKKIYDYINFNKYKSNLLNENREIENVPESLIENNIIHPDDVTKYRQLYIDIDNGKLKTSCKIRMFFENIKEYIWVQIIYTVITNSFEIIGTMKNIADEKKTDGILKFIVKNEFDYLVRADYKKNECIVYFNNLKNFNTLEQKTIITIKSFMKLITPHIINYKKSFDSEETTLKIIFRSLKKKGYFKKQYQIIDENKNIRIKEIKIYSINMKKGIFYIVISDITDIYNENKNKNQALEEALKLAEHANKSKSIFLSTMSHDIKTPMNAIMGMTDLTYSLIGKDNAQAKKNLDVIKNSSKTLMDIINEVLDMNRISSGQFKFSSNEFQINNLANSILKYFDHIIKLKKQKIQIHINIKHNFLLGDSCILKKIIYNLMDNAIKYTPQYGKIDIYIDETFDKYKKDFAFFQIKIKDNGIGISKEEQSKIFEPFYRGKNAAIENGTGLGLPIVKAILNLRGGNFKVESELEKGSTFIINLPFKINTNCKISSKEIDPCDSYCNSINTLDFKNKKVLIVEDNEVNRLIARKNLEKYNLIVEEAVNGEEGYNKFINSPSNYYSLILMDIKMPILNGIDCTKKIRESNHINSKDIPIVAITANTFVQDKNSYFNAGMNDYVSKPINISYVEKILEKYIKKE